jgi:UDP-N-acetylmuramyl pentapeptide phosphotransferase/UDP-N-acetylglucosamine-1-phosphate transferase
MGPWAPVAGGLVGVLLGVVAVVLLAGQAGDFRERLSLVFLVVGLGLLGASGTLLADEVRMVRWRAREASLRPAAWTDTTASLVNGLTPARLLLLVSGFVLFLAAYVSSR